MIPDTMPYPIDSPELIKEECNRFYGLYERKAKSFRMALISVTSLVTIVFVLVFYPYVSFRGEKYELEAQLKDLRRDIRDVKLREDEHLKLINKMSEHARAAVELLGGIKWDELQQAAAAHRERLAEIEAIRQKEPNAARELRGEVSQPELSTLTHEDASNDECFRLSGREWTRCAFARQLLPLHIQATAPFQRTRVLHLRNDLVKPLGVALKELHTAFRMWLLGEATAWEPGGSRAGVNLRSEYDRFMQAYHERIVEHERFIVGRMTELQNRLRELKNTQKVTEETLARVNTKLEEIKEVQQFKTPFGELPVGLNDLILLFPVLLAAGFYLCASLFSETLQLRQVFHRLCRARDPGHELFTSRHVGLIAPVWIDPLQPPTHRLVRSLILALPALGFIVAIALLLVNRLLWGHFMTEVRLGTWLYVLMYLLSISAIIEGTRRAWGAFRGFSIENV